MKTLFVVLLLSTLLYLIALPVHQYLCLQRAARDLTQRNFEAAWVSVEHVLGEWPNFFETQAKTLCGQITLQQAQALAADPHPDFGGAVRLLLGLPERCQGHEEKDAQPLLEKLGTLQLAGATKHCQEKDYSSALHEFQEISTLAYPDRILREAHSEAAWCRLDYARALTEDEWLLEEALGQMERAMNSGDGAVRKAALRQIPSVVEKEISSWLGRGQYVRAFEVLNQRRQSFGNELEIATFFPRLESQVEMQVFGITLAQQCLDKPQKLQDKKSVPVTEVNFQPGGPTTANLTVQNKTRYTLRILLRGPEQSDLQLKPKEKKQLWLEPAEYVVAMFAPGNCQVKPRQTSWNVEPFVRHNVGIVPQN